MVAYHAGDIKRKSIDAISAFRTWVEKPDWLTASSDYNLPFSTIKLEQPFWGSQFMQEINFVQSNSSVMLSEIVVLFSILIKCSSKTKTYRWLKKASANWQTFQKLSEWIQHVKGAFFN